MNGWMVYAHFPHFVFCNLSLDRLFLQILPQCWEQVSHKHPERRQLIAQVTFFFLTFSPGSKKKTFSHIFPPLQVVGLLASHVQASIRGSLLVSLLLQLVDDRDDRVAQTAARSLALLVHTLDDSDKLNQVVTDSLQHINRVSFFRCLQKLQH